MRKKSFIYSCIGVIVFALALISSLGMLGLTPFPRDFMRAWYEPWKTDSVIHGVPTIVHKPVGHDVFRQIYPFKKLSIDSIRSGHLPLWNPYNASGTPLFASGVHSILNPFMLAFFVSRESFAWTILYIGQFVVITLAFLLYAESIGVSAGAALIASLVLLGSGFIISNSLFATFLYSYAGLPLLLWCIEMIVSKKRRGFIVLPFAIAWTILTGFPQLTLYIFIVSGCYAIVRIFSLENNSARSFIYILFCGIFGIGMSMVQLFPMYELYTQAAITTESSSFIFRTFLMPFTHMLSLLVPNFFGNPSTYNYWGYADYVETAASIGSIGVFFAWCSWWVREKRMQSLRTFYLVVITVSLMLSLRWVGSEWLYHLPIPILTTGIPSRIMGIVTFALCVLVGMGVDVYRSKKSSIQIHRLLLYTWIGIAVVVMSTFILNSAHVSCHNVAIPYCFAIAFRNSVLEFSVFTIALLFIIGGERIRIARTSRMICIGVALLVFTSGMYNAYKFVPLMRGNDLMPTHPLLSKLSTYGPVRVGYLGTLLPTDLATHYRFFDTNYYNPLYIKRYGELISYVNSADKNMGLTRSDVNVVYDATVSAQLSYRRNRFWDLTGTGLLISKKDAGLFQDNQIAWEDGNWKITKRQTALPRAYLVTDILVEKDEDKALATLFSPTFESTKTAVVDTPVAGVDAATTTTGTVTIDRYLENSVDLSVDASSNSLLVLSDTYYAGWKATVDGIATNIYRANYVFRGVMVPKGNHTVVFTYEPSSVYWGAMISFCSLILVLIVGFSIYYGKIKL